VFKLRPAKSVSCRHAKGHEASNSEHEVRQNSRLKHQRRTLWSKGDRAIDKDNEDEARTESNGLSLLRCVRVDDSHPLARKWLILLVDIRY
jgi:hypothetical protein